MLLRAPRTFPLAASRVSQEPPEVVEPEEPPQRGPHHDVPRHGRPTSRKKMAHPRPPRTAEYVSSDENFEDEDEAGVDGVAADLVSGGLLSLVSRTLSFRVLGSDIPK